MGHTTGPPQPRINGKNILPKIIIQPIPISRRIPLIIQRIARRWMLRRTRPFETVVAAAGAPACPRPGDDATALGTIGLPHLVQNCPPEVSWAPQPSQYMIHPLPDDTLRPPISSTWIGLRAVTPCEGRLQRSRKRPAPSPFPYVAVFSCILLGNSPLSSACLRRILISYRSC